MFGSAPTQQFKNRGMEALKSMNNSTKRQYKHSLTQSQDLIHPIQVVIDPEKIKEYHLKKLYELSKPGPGILDFKIDGSVWRDGKILTERCSYEQRQWVLRRLKAPEISGMRYS